MTAIGVGQQIGRWRVAARLARREVRRHWARSALVVLIIALPVLATQAVAIRQQSFLLFQPRGDADAAVAVGRQRDDPAAAGSDRSVGFDPRLGRPEDPSADRVETGVSVRDWVTAAPGEGVGADDLLEVVVVGFVPDASHVPLAEGRLPADRHEIVASAPLVEGAGVAVGDEIQLIATDVTLEVVGLARPGAARGAVAWAGPPPPGADPADPAADWVVEALVEVRPIGSPFVSIEMSALFWFPDTDPVVPPAPGGSWTSPVPREPATLVIAAVVAAIAVGFVATVCSAAFAIGARRQLRSLGTLAATGAAPADLVRAVLLQGTTLGLVGTAGATALALVGRLAALTVLDDGWVVPWALDRVLAVAVLGVAAGTLAALVPALTASRIPTLSALAGRAPTRRRRLRSPYLGAGLVVVGLGVLSVAAGASDRQDTVGAAGAAVGVLLVMAGAVALSPGLVALVARLCAHRGGTTRLAGRSLARSGSRSAAVVASTAVAVAIPVVLLVWGARTQPVDSPPYGLAITEDRVADAMASISTVTASGNLLDQATSDRAVAELRELMGPGAVTGRSIAVSDGNGDGARGVALDVEALRRVAGPGPLVDALADGSIVALSGGPRYPEDRQPSEAGALDVAGRTTVTVRPDELPDVLLLLVLWGDAMLLAEDDTTATVPTQWSVTLLRPGPMSEAEERRLASVGQDQEWPTRADLRRPDGSPPAVDPSSVDVSVSPAGDGWGRSARRSWGVVELLVVLGAIVLALAVIGTASALAAADGRSDERIIAAVGAPPSAVRRRRALEALLTAAAATALGTGLGTTATLVVLHHPFVPEEGLQPAVSVPYVALGATAGGIVATVGAVTWLALALGGLRRRRDLALVDV